MGKLYNRLTNLNGISKNILKYGLLIVLISLIVSNILLRNADSILLLNIAREFTCSSVYVFCEVIIGTIMFDVMVDKS